MLNRCEFIGNLGRDPEIRTTQSGDKVANFSMAVSEKWKDKSTGEQREKTDWIPVVVWGPLAGVVEKYLRKGSKVYVAGKFTTRKWQDKSGNDRYSTDVVLQGFNATLVMLDGKRDNQQSGGYDNHPDPSRAQEPDGYGGMSQGPDYDDSIPF